MSTVICNNSNTAKPIRIVMKETRAASFHSKHNDATKRVKIYFSQNDKATLFLTEIGTTSKRRASSSG